MNPGQVIVGILSAVLFVGRAEAAGDPRGILNTRPSAPSSTGPSDRDIPRGVAPEDRDVLPTLSFAQLRELFPDLQARQAPPFRWQLGLGSHVPFQLAAIGVDFEGFAVPWLRLSGSYGAGISTQDKQLVFSNYAEASIGVRVYMTHTTTNQELTMRPNGAKPRTLHAALPVYNGLLLEAGVITGLIAWERCATNCGAPSPDDRNFDDYSRQLVLPFAGIRYLYYYDVASDHAGMRHRAFTEAYADVILAPFDPLPNDALWERSPINRAAAGARLGVDFTKHSNNAYDGALSRWGLALGILPHPLLPFVELRIAFDSG